jgi:hypothetical protein
MEIRALCTSLRLYQGAELVLCTVVLICWIDCLDRIARPHRIKQTKIDRKAHRSVSKVKPDVSKVKLDEDEAADAADVKMEIGMGDASAAPPPQPGSSDDSDTTPLINHEALRGTFMGPPERTVYTFNLDDKSLMPDHIASTIIDAGVAATAMVENEFDTVYPGQISDLHLIKDQGELWPLYQEYTKVRARARVPTSLRTHPRALLQCSLRAPPQISPCTRGSARARCTRTQAALCSL